MPKAPVVSRMADAMQEELEKHSEQYGDSWLTTPLHELVASMKRHVSALSVALEDQRSHPAGSTQHETAKRRAQKYATHVANYSAMIRRRLGLDGA